MDKLERKLKSLAEQVELWGLSKEDVVRFIKDLISLHKISFTDIYPALGENFSRLKSLLTEAQKHASAIELKQEIRQETVEKKGESLSMEVLYEGDLRSKQPAVCRSALLFRSWGLFFIGMRARLLCRAGLPEIMFPSCRRGLTGIFFV